MAFGERRTAIARESTSRPLAFARNHWRHHSRFYLSVLLGIVVWAAGWTLDPQLRLVLGGDAFYAAYLIWAVVLVNRLTPAGMRKRSSVEDEGIILIVVLTIMVIALSLQSLFSLFEPDKNAHVVLLVASIASVPLGWCTLHVIFALRYAHLYYTRGGKSGDAGGLAFPETTEPAAWDFIYHAFVVGATAQVSDVQVTSSRLRRLTWGHSMIAFFYNTVLIALAVNIAVQAAN